MAKQYRTAFIYYNYLLQVFIGFLRTNRPVIDIYRLNVFTDYEIPKEVIGLEKSIDLSKLGISYGLDFDPTQFIYPLNMLFRFSSIIINKRTSLLISMIATNQWYHQQWIANNNSQSPLKQFRPYCIWKPYPRLMRSALLAKENKLWMKDVYNKCMESVIEVSLDSRDEVKIGGYGSGWLLDGDDGLILTNYHCVFDAHYIKIRLQHSYRVSDLRDVGEDVDYINFDYSRSSYWWAEVIYVEAHLDLALLRLPSIIPGLLTGLEIANNDVVRGAEVMVMGHPFLDDTLNVGYVIHQSRHNYFSNCFMYGDLMWPTNQLFTTINITSIQGFSGGPVVNTSGQVIGVLFCGLFKESSITRRQDLLDFINRSKTIGHQLNNKLVNQRKVFYSGKPLIGVFLGYDKTHKLYNVIDYMPYAHSIRNVLSIGDKITAIDGKPVENLEDIMKFIDNVSIEQLIVMDILRNKQKFSVNFNIQTIENKCFF
ncbi:periplasmic serine endoprotease DegP-like [Oppia nitens]|uniref:periplasmic serine endoprotease DegP-like n=1 Tax=Oppia nitens TaxID=1686743 RepID=UPI0023DAF8CC|nr:periplasmic serine endoprotease DegP-like [Oppia nitens]